MMLALRLFLPESWTSDRARLTRAGVPAEYRTARTKPELAPLEIDRAIAAGVRFGCVLTDAGYGMSAPFRQGLTGPQTDLSVGVPRHLKVYPADVRMIWPVAERGCPRQRHVPDVPSLPAEVMLADAKWHTISWRTGTKGKLKARFANARCGSRTEQFSGSGTRGGSICPARRFGLLVNTGSRERRNTISPTCRRRTTCACSRPSSSGSSSASRMLTAGSGALA